MKNIKLLAEICEAPGAPGHEQKIREVVLREVKPLVDEIKIDNMGNVVAIKKGKKRKKVMIAAHMDEIGFIVTHIDEKGFVYFHNLGGFDPKTLTAQRVIIHGKKDVMGVMGSKPIHLMNAGTNTATFVVPTELADKVSEPQTKLSSNAGAGGYSCSASSVNSGSTTSQPFEPFMAFEGNTSPAANTWVTAVGSYVGGGSYYGSNSIVTTTGTASGEYIILNMPHSLKLSAVKFA